MGKVKYSEEMKLQTVKYVLEGGKSATKVAKELGIDVNTVCRWMKDYRETHNQPSYEAEQRIRKQSVEELVARNKALEKELKRKEKELADEKEKVEILKNPAHLYATTRMKCEAIHLQRALYSVRKMCEALQIRQGQYYQWLSRQEKKNRRREQESQMVHQVERAFKDSYETYGCRKIKHALIAQGTHISEWRVRRIMKENGLYPVTRRKYRPYKKAGQKGVYSRNEESQNIDSELCKRALGNAIARHGTAEGLIFHSDRGSQYSSKAYRSMLRHYQIVPSMSAPGCPYNNSPVDSFFATLKRELIYRK